MSKIVKAFIKKGITRKQFSDMGVVNNRTQDLLDGSGGPYYGRIEEWSIGKVFVFKDRELPDILWVDLEFIVIEERYEYKESL